MCLNARNTEEDRLSRNRAAKQSGDDEVEQVWFGYSPQVGWVAMDRLLSANQGQRTVKLVLCRDWSRFEVSKGEWDKLFVHWTRALELAPPEEREQMRISLDRVREAFWKVRMQIKGAWEEALRARQGLPTTRCVDGTFGSDERHCWKCQGSLTGCTVKCTKCGWYLCPCGGCGCGWYRYSSD